MIPTFSHRIAWIADVGWLLVAGMALLGSGCVQAMAEQPPRGHAWETIGLKPERATLCRQRVACAGKDRGFKDRRSFGLSESTVLHPKVGSSKSERRLQGEGRKYSKLLKRIEVKNDRIVYGDFHDWGYWSGTSWAGHSKLPPGYWVYVAPNWHIFGRAAGVEPSDNPPILGKRKYGRLLRRIKVPEDVKSYGEYHDYGYCPITSYRGYTDLPVGYWVYVAPCWYVFGEPPTEKMKRIDNEEGVKSVCRRETRGVGRSEEKKRAEGAR